MVSAPHPTTSSVCSVSAHVYHASVRHKAFSEGDIHIEFKSTRRYRTNNSCCRVGAAAAKRICGARGSYVRATRHSIAASTNTEKKKNLQRQFRTRLVSSTTPVFPNTRNHLGLSPRHLITLATHSLVCTVSCLFSLPPRVRRARGGTRLTCERIMKTVLL